MKATLPFLLLLLLPGAAQQEVEDLRTRVLLERLCENDFSRRQLTLFANGTLRLRDGVGATRVMRLAELGSVELEAFLRRLEAIRFDDLAPSYPGLDGEWVESCRLDLHLPELDQLSFEYGPYDTISLGLRHVLFVVDDLMLEFEFGQPGSTRVREFKVEVGDLVVRRRDGALFEVLGFTLEGTGMELQGIDQPVTLYILKEDVQIEFDPVGDEDGA